MIRRPRPADILLWIDIDPEIASGQTPSCGPDGPRAFGIEFRCSERCRLTIVLDDTADLGPQAIGPACGGQRRTRVRGHGAGRLVEEGKRATMRTRLRGIAPKFGAA
ncbi:hypothetical protein [Nocardia cyriacigeorgica]|uniref:Uncharacterized protein n=1 Tax=Nocardia cyriacigeorgica TaxID=135487 RepID=A0A4U8VY53_9NOCA|nr:hypothetical protein [Nocardia cyriacigeorgica]MBF6160503.1 hypothetical protein [Nocardia cyriacigeorgica]MBF6199730.1 hypothetical protein [Nocardia cyriacigeorgica]MBF6319971.1 hypothetical protein [Nocardia cyriacigeorgica]MBF6517171.1 hypothetical protein [Nocardia cyriacigeorgica]MBF6534389.1 hypothetical protein [Nocardia cyriacigeorgica]